MKQMTNISIVILAITGSFVFNVDAAIVINEIDYDQPGTDTSEFIELFNSGSTIISLDDYTVDLINGSNSSRYRSIDLSGYSIGAGGYFVLCGGTGTVTNCDYSFTTSNSWFQNGAPDAIGLYSNTDLLDSLSYEGTLSPFTEGDVLTISDNSTEISSISRILDGVDSDNNTLDFQSGCITPGSANIAGSGDCSITAVSAVPVPAAAWLFGSGVIGLLGAARRKA